MGTASPEFEHLRGCARPVVFETGLSDYPFTVAGTAFMVGYRKSLYVLTARHVVRDFPKERLAIIVSPAGDRLPLLQRWEVNFEGDEDECVDLLVFRADVMGVPKSVRQASYLLHLTPAVVSDWFGSRDTDVFFLFGYPMHANGPDYETSKVDMNQYLLNGRYIGPSAIDGCFEVSVNNPLSLPTFDGMSGSPVFSLRTSIGTSAQPTFCGMALRGTAESRKVHFLGSDTILAALEAANAN